MTAMQRRSRLDLEEHSPNWRQIRLKYTIESLRSGVWGDEPLEDGSDVLCIRAADFDRAHLTADLTSAPLRHIPYNQLPQHLLRRGDLILEKSGGGDTQPVGLVVRFDLTEDAVCSNFAARMVVGSRYSSRFLTYLHAHLYSAGINVKAIKQNTGIQNLDADAYLDERVPIPPLDEQRAIADFLDRETETIDALVAKKQRLIELLQEKRTALISHAVTKGLDPDVPTKDSDIEWLGPMPAHWAISPLMRLVEPGRPIMYGIVLPGPDFEGGVPIVKGGDVAPDKLDLQRLNRTDPEIEKRYVRSRLRGGDIVYAIRGSIGAAAVVPDALEGANLTQDTARVAPRDGVEVGWLMYALQSRPVFAQLEAGAVGAAIRGINIFSLKRALLPVPPRPEQGSIRDYLDVQTRILDELAEKVARAVDRLVEYRSTLITAAVTGHIDVRDHSGSQRPPHGGVGVGR